MLLPPEASRITARLVREIAGVREERKVLRLTLRGLASLFECDQGAAFLYRRARARLHKVTGLTEDDPWASEPPGGGLGEGEPRESESRVSESILAFFRLEKPAIPEDTIMAPVRAGRQVIGVVALRRRAGFARGAGKITTEILRIIGTQLGYRRDLDRYEAEAAIAKAMLSGVAPKNVTYRVFHQLRRFIDYDHGATLLERAEDACAKVLARQVAWREGRSDIVAAAYPFTWTDLPSGARVFILREGDSNCREALDRIREDGSPPKRSILTGVIEVSDRPLACVEVSSAQPNFFLDKDISVLSRFLPYLTWCVRAQTANLGGRDE